MNHEAVIHMCGKGQELDEQKRRRCLSVREPAGKRVIGVDEAGGRALEGR